jgi:hypothetical protein
MVNGKLAAAQEKRAPADPMLILRLAWRLTGTSQVRTLDAVGASARFKPESRPSMVSSPLLRKRQENLAGLTKLYTRERSKKHPSWTLFSEPDDRLSTQHSEN